MKLRRVASVFLLTSSAGWGLTGCAAALQDQATEPHYAEVHTELAPYEPDLVVRAAPKYPIGPRGQRYQGTGVFRVKLDYKTGHAVSVRVLQSPGQVSLEQAAIDALKRWAVKPRTWHTIDVVIRFAAKETVVESGKLNFRSGKIPTFHPFRSQ